MSILVIEIDGKTAHQQITCLFLIDKTGDDIVVTHGTSISYIYVYISIYIKDVEDGALILQDVHGQSSVLANLAKEVLCVIRILPTEVHYHGFQSHQIFRYSR